ncbi:LysR family transcriptional regulator [Novosphingobium sp.]|uniref:LysR family transcriptional regulator n=1 Tax=Novosphingobium sp. TaxID=1874826 RepID=UPI0031DACC80
MDRMDLNLLVVFEAILRERSITRAGQRLGLSQPAMSHALNRLRHRMKDQLFVRSPQGMVPTPLGERLADPVRHALTELRSVLHGEEFLPETARQRFVIAVSNYAAIAFVGPILQRARALAPQVRFSFRPSGTLDVPDLLDRGELDLALVAHAPLLQRFQSRQLIEEDFVGVARRGHPVLEGSPDVTRFAAMAHLAISSSGDDLTRLDALLAERGLSRQIAAEAPYLSAGAVLTQSDMVAVVARHIGEEFQRAYPVQLFELPVQPQPLVATMVWQSRFQDQPAHRWLRELIGTTAAELSSERGAWPA